MKRSHAAAARLFTSLVTSLAPSLMASAVALACAADDATGASGEPASRADAGPVETARPSDGTQAGGGGGGGAGGGGGNPDAGPPAPAVTLENPSWTVIDARFARITLNFVLRNGTSAPIESLERVEVSFQDVSSDVASFPVDFSLAATSSKTCPDWIVQPGTTSSVMELPVNWVVDGGYLVTT